MTQEHDLDIPLRSVTLHGNLNLPDKTHSLVIFAHGSGSSRLSPRNRYVAEILNTAGIATLLFDLLTEAEDTRYENRFNIDLLAERLVEVTRWCKKQSWCKQLSIGYFGASTGAAAALQASTMLTNIAAIVSRGGRPDLAHNLDKVTVPTLLIVGGYDTQVIELNQQAYAQLKCIKKLEIVSGATHLFEESGTLEKVAELAKEWLVENLAH